MGKKNITINAVDIFCGAGGLTHGLELSGVNVIAGIDLDPTCDFAYKTNNKAEFIQKSIDQVSSDEVAALYPKEGIRLLAGCAPCQPFSTYTHGRDTRTDSKWGLLYQFGRLVEALKPELVTMENVPSLRRHEVFQDFLALLGQLGYELDIKVVHCPDYGIPQQRKRLVLVGSRLGPIKLPEATHKPDNYVTVRQAIGELPSLNHGEADEHDPLHVARKLIPVNIQRLQHSKPGGTWKDWPLHLRAACHRKEGGLSFKSVYARMQWDRPAPTITTQSFNFGTGRFGHPEQDRALTLREAAILQTFPKTYKFTEKAEDVTFSNIGRLIGNAVPVRLGTVIGEAFIKHLETTVLGSASP